MSSSERPGQEGVGIEKYTTLSFKVMKRRIGGLTLRREIANAVGLRTNTVTYVIRKLDEIGFEHFHGFVTYCNAMWRGTDSELYTNSSYTRREIKKLQRSKKLLSAIEGITNAMNLTLPWKM